MMINGEIYREIILKKRDIDTVFPLSDTLNHAIAKSNLKLIDEILEIIANYDD